MDENNEKTSNLKYHVKSLMEENKDDVRDYAREALLNICEAVIRSPYDRTTRELQLNGEVVVKKLLPAIGAMECLFDIGFIEVCILMAIFFPFLFLLLAL